MLQDAHMHVAENSVLELSPGIRRVLLNSTCSKDYYAVKTSAESDDETEIIPFFGIHPWYAYTENTSDSLIKDTLEDFPSSGIGECGLDFRPDYRKIREFQINIFEAQLDLSIQYARPLSIHCVKAWEQLFLSLKRFPGFPAPFILHSFYGPKAALSALLKLGGYISLSAVSLRNPEKSFSTIKAIPENRLLIESDIISGGGNFTIDKHLKILENNYLKVSELRSVPAEQLMETVWKNGTIFSY